MRILPTSLALLLLLLTLDLAHASKVKVWHQYQQSHFEKAKFQNAVITSDGIIKLSRFVKPISGLDAANVWDLAEDKAGNVYAATGDEGKLYKITPDGKASVFHTIKDSHLFSLLALPDGTLYVGTGPTGKLIRISSAGKVEATIGALDSYVWCLAYDPTSQSVFAGTGPKGKIYRIGADGKSSVFYATKQEHILSLAVGPKGTLYAGTDKGGLVYRFDAAGKPFILYDANQPEVRALLATPNALYAGTSAPVARKGATSTKSDDKPAPGENSLYRIAPDGAVREIYRDKTMILRLAQIQGKLLVATGMQGQLFEINESTKEKTEIARVEAAQIHCVLQRRDGSLILGTGDPGKLFVLESSFAAKGTVTSDVLDTKLQSKWGSMSWKGAGNATVAVRSGNVAEPDETWSPWSMEQTAESKAQAPLGRYLQYRVTLSSENPKSTPEFRDFSLRYQTVNQAPEVTSLEVPNLQTKDVENGKKLKIKWNASDPNDDDVTYDIYCKKDGWKDWVLLEENQEKNLYDWDTTGMPSGLYQIKIVASDRKDNAAEDALTAERVSAVFPVTHLAPNVSVKVVSIKNGVATVEASASDPYVRLTEASFAVDGKRWTNVFPTDGLFDSKSETFRFDTDQLRPGTHVLVLRVKNAAGNVGSGDLVINTP